jgi:hypothetical protein
VDVVLVLLLAESEELKVVVHIRDVQLLLLNLFKVLNFFLVKQLLA